MLVLTRRPEESICIGDPRNPDGPPLAEVKLLGFGDGKVRLGVVAEKSVPIHRKEVYQRIQRETKPAA